MGDDTPLRELVREKMVVPSWFTPWHDIKKEMLEVRRGRPDLLKERYRGMPRAAFLDEVRRQYAAGVRYFVEVEGRDVPDMPIPDLEGES